VNNQGYCGSCWTFSAVGATQAAFNIVADNPDFDLDLSEENLVSNCFTYYPPYSSYCGGSHYKALEYIGDYGIVDENCFPYVDTSCYCEDTTCHCTYDGSSGCSNARCSDRCSDWPNRLWHLEEYDYVYPDQDTIKEYLINYGPLSAAMAIGYPAGGYWDGEIYRCTYDDQVNHAIVIVGYNDTG